MNLFEREPDAPTSEQKLSEYDKEYQQPIGKPLNAFDQKIIDSLVSNNKDSRPPQFAWPRVDPIVEKPKPTPIPGIPRDPSEYDRAYTWREADRVRPVKPRDSNPFALDEGDKDASKWVSEHDEKEDAAVDASHKAILPAAGKPLNVVKKEDNPTFYAWPPEAPKPVPRKVFVDREIVHSEYEDNFRPKTPERTRPAKIVNQLNLFSTDPDNNLQSFEPIESEYDRNFEPPSRSESPDPIEKIANKNLVERPPMFAWGLAEGPKENTEPYVIPSGIEPTEYDSKFSWPKNVQVNRSAQGSWQTSTPNGPIAGNGKDAKLWKSEYDQKCEEFRAKQQQVDETNKITAGKEVPHDPEAPANFAWKPSGTQKQLISPFHSNQSDLLAENSRPPVQLNSAIPFDDSTEYGDHFLSWPLPPAPVSYSLVVSIKELTECCAIRLYPRTGKTYQRYCHRTIAEPLLESLNMMRISRIQLIPKLLRSTE